MRLLALLPLTCGLLCAASPTTQAQVVADFESGNLGGWSLGNGFDSIQAGGNPGQHLRNPNLDTFAPQPRTTTPGSPFLGDWRAQGVTSVGVDLITYSTQFQFDRELTLILTSGSCSVYFMGTERVPQPGTGWKSFQFDVDAQSATLPAGWEVLDPCGSDDDTWNSVMTNVTEVRFFYGNPTFFFIFDIWDFGIDNVRLDFGIGTSFCSGDGSGEVCPCSNYGAAGAGCSNSTGVGAMITGGGSASVASDLLTFVGTGLVPSQPALLFAGQTPLNGGAGMVFGDGLFCAGGQIVRLTVAVPDGTGGATWGPGLGAIGGWSAGQTRLFQAWYRDTLGSPCGTGNNLSQAVSVTFTP